jgi:hypothetical protein
MIMAMIILEQYTSILPVLCQTKFLTLGLLGVTIIFLTQGRANVRTYQDYRIGNQNDGRQEVGFCFPMQA